MRFRKFRTFVNSVLIPFWYTVRRCLPAYDGFPLNRILRLWKLYTFVRFSHKFPFTSKCRSVPFPCQSSGNESFRHIDWQFTVWQAELLDIYLTKKLQYKLWICRILNLFILKILDLRN